MSRFRPAVLAGLLLAAVPAAAFDAGSLDSVVSVLPEWPQGKVAPEIAQARRERPEGTGFAVLPGGYVATNVHVINGALSLRVRLSDGRIRPAEIVGQDPPTDIALIKTDIDLPPIPPGGEPALGAPVCAVGNAFGLDLSVTCGVVSARHKTGTGFNPIEDFIQTDAAANPGASGGPLLAADGRFVGMISAIINKDVDANIGVNFAASAPLVMRVVEDLAARGRVRRARSGLRVVDLPEEARGEHVGARVRRVTSNSAADDAGFEIGDLIVAIGERRIRQASDVTGALGLLRPGDEVSVDIRRDGGRRTLTLTLTQ